MNNPELWLKHFPWPDAASNKYRRGSVLVAGGGIASTGAARLAAISALRVSGLVTIASPADALAVYAASLLAVMVRPYADEAGFCHLLNDKKYHALLLGPGMGVGEESCRKVSAALATGKPVLLDADAITSFAGKERLLFDEIRYKRSVDEHGGRQIVMTPHEGEFKRLFHHLQQAGEGSGELVKQAAQISRAVIVLKGNDTQIAAPDGRLVINEKASPWLATAGSGDVLAGVIAGLMAGGMEAFSAACAGVWLHSRAAEILGVGLIADELPAAIALALKELKK